jgi:hypothetical protein
MLQLHQLLRLISELAFVLLGLLLIQVAASGRLGFDNHSPIWYGAAALVIWFGIRALAKARREVAKGDHWIRGGSLVLLGSLMLAISVAPPVLIRPLVSGAGVVLILRGLASVVIALRVR